MKIKGFFLSLMLLVIACASSKSKNGPDADRSITSDLEASEEKSPVEFATELQGLDAVPIADQQELQKSNDGEPNDENNGQGGAAVGTVENGATGIAGTAAAIGKTGADDKSTAGKKGNSKTQDGKFANRDGVNSQSRIKSANSVVGSSGIISGNSMMGGKGISGGNTMNGSNGINSANEAFDKDGNSARADEANFAKESIESKNKKGNRTLAAKSVDQIIEYKVKSGDTFMKISFQLLGDLTRWREIYETNKKTVANPNLLSKGTLLKVHVFNVVSVQKNGEPYFIKRGDTLAKISKWIYGTIGKWKVLWDNNKQLIHHPDKIFAGFTLYYKDDKQPNNRTIATDKSNHGATKQ